jgi:transposase-like protein
MRNALAHAGKSGRRVVSAFIATAFAQNDAKAASQQWRRIADQLRPKLPKLAKLMDDAEPDVLAYMTFPAQHRTKLHSTNPIERLNGEIKRRTPPRSPDRVPSRDRMKRLRAFHRRRHLPQRSRDHQARRRSAARAERRMSGPKSPLHDP